MSPDPDTADGPRPPAPPPPGDFGGGIPVAGTFDTVYGLELLDDGATDGIIRARLAIGDELRQPTGLLHGGALAAMAESMASWGTWRGAGGAGITVMGMSNDTSFLRPFVDGHVHGTGTPTHRGRTRWLWEIRFTDDAGRLGAVTRVNIAIRSADR